MTGEEVESREEDERRSTLEHALRTKRRAKRPALLDDPLPHDRDRAGPALVFASEAAACRIDDLAAAHAHRAERPEGARLQVEPCGARVDGRGPEAR
jgi:hypothetical protein